MQIKIARDTHGYLYTIHNLNGEFLGGGYAQSPEDAQKQVGLFWSRIELCHATLGSELDMGELLERSPDDAS